MRYTAIALLLVCVLPLVGCQLYHRYEMRMLGWMEEEDRTRGKQDGADQVTASQDQPGQGNLEQDEQEPRPYLLPPYRNYSRNRSGI
jgi:hypothetical protein